MTTVDTTIVRYDVITTERGAAVYRDNAQIVARRDRYGVLSGIEVVVSWAGHTGRAAIYGEHTLDSLAEDDSYSYGLLAAISDADFSALSSLIRHTSSNRRAANDYGWWSVDYEAVRNDVAAALGEEPHLCTRAVAALGADPHQRIPDTSEEAFEWLRNYLVADDLVEIVPA